MAFDRYMVIGKPLYYLTIMSPLICILILVVAWTIGFIHLLAQLAFVVNLPLRSPNILNSFDCYIPWLIIFACTDTYNLEFTVTANRGFISLLVFFLLILSYIFILATLQEYASGGSSKTPFLYHLILLW